MKSLIDSICKNEFKVYNDSELRNFGLESRVLDGLGLDNYQNHGQRIKGYLGVLVLNYFNRSGDYTNLKNGEKLMVPAFELGEALGLDLSLLANYRDGDREIICDTVFDGERDLYIDVCDSHFLVQRDYSSDLESFTLTELACEYSMTKNPVFKDHICKKYMPTVKLLVKRMESHLSGNGDPDILFSAAGIGLLDVIDRFDHRRGVKFETYAPPRIRGAMLDDLRAIDWLSRIDRSRKTVMTRFAREFKETNDYYPAKNDFKVFWVDSEYPIENFDDFYDGIFRAKLISGENVIGRIDFNKKVLVKDRLESKVTQGPEREAMSHELMELVRLDFLAIPKKYREALYDVIVNGETMAIAAENIELSESRMSQIHSHYISQPGFLRRVKEYFEIDTEKDITLDLRELDEM